MSSSQQTNGAVASTSAPNAAAATQAGGKPAVQPSEVGWLFVPQYYTFLNQNPGRLHCFYTKKSTLIHGTEQEEEKQCFGQQEIHDRITALGFQDCKVYVSNVDSQSSASGGIIIQVLGEMSNKNGPWRKFAQTFFLAEQPNGYFVLNDIFRYLKDEDESEEQAEEVEEDIRKDEAEAKETGRDVAGAKADISAIAQPGATPHVQPVIAANPESSKTAAIAAAPQDTSVTEVADEKKAEPETSAPAAAAEEAKATTTAAAEPSPVEAAKEETAPAAAAAAPAAAAPSPVAATAAPSAPTQAAAAPPAEPTGPPKPKTWANLAASNATTWGSAVRSDAKGTSTTAPAVTVAAGARSGATGARSNATSQQQQQQQSQSHGNREGGTVQPGAVFIKNAISENGITESSLRSVLEERFGQLKELQMVPSRACAFATFDSPETARKAIAASQSGGGVAVGDKKWKVSIEEKRNRPGQAGGAPGGPRGEGQREGQRGERADRGGFKTAGGRGRGRGGKAPAA
ncbi:hypothetical protein BDZ90DRAFT_232952 [Jaminaea rosea]|uniref:NTF2-domain-containing protein n=1 Tax=Jaminaea rosea TaxID=1569628 RepID=A0A316UNJ5_9BASI|nr:hypothetical protein BDZ90DRAFT_232952 [Jaminaea rosea]PWN26857.1 hypothetical protein BDZ90DRAFT_232952 [Jaminaea rosea]